ncbi:MAG: hypothetical protein HPY55_13955 [Firmicutes bacterium]|nr:hypothetical protein [Bacillota bacterium]
MKTVSVFRQRDGTVVTRPSESELDALARRYARALLDEVAQKYPNVVVTLKEEDARLAVSR